MTRNADTNVHSIREIVEKSLVLVHFQPLVSIKRKAVIGFEALSRGVDAAGGLISPAVIFQQAQAEGLVLELDRLCRQAALEAFAPEYARDPGLVLSINIDPSDIEAAPGSNHLRDAVAARGIAPSNVSIEIVESRVGSLSTLERFTKTYRDYGFLITLDDVGVGHSNLDRVAHLKPDIIKIDRSLVSDIDKRYHQQQIVKSLVGLSHRIGALVIAEGIETEEEAVALLSLGLDVMQGFYFSRPGELAALPIEACLTRISRVSDCFRSFAATRMEGKRKRWKRYRELIDAILSGLASLAAGAFENYLANAVIEVPGLECAYVLDRDGKQITQTHCQMCLLNSQRKVIFQPAPKGADHSLKDYYLPISEEIRTYITEPYISFATGNLCQTISALFQNTLGGWHILCLDVDVDRDI